MNNLSEQKKNLLIDWLLRNNIDIQNTINAQMGVQDYQREAIFNANIITSVLLKEKIFDAGFDGLENLLETDSEIIVNLRECTKIEEFRDILNSDTFRNIGSTFAANQVLGIYNREKEYGNINNNVNNENYEQNKETNHGNTNIQNNKYEDYDYNRYTQDNFNNNQRQHDNQSYRRNVNNINTDRKTLNTSQYQYNEYQGNKLYEPYMDKDNYIHSNGEHNKETICEHGLNHIINGIKTITCKLPDGNYSFEMVIPVG